MSQMRDVMQIALTLVGQDPEAADAASGRIAEALAARGRPVKPSPSPGPSARDFRLDPADLQDLRRAALAAVAGLPVDICVQPVEGRRKRLLLADMDSTIIACECLDELADFAGRKAEVAAITERAMRGELEFEGALRERVAMLAGLPESQLERAYAERVRLNPGARTFVRTLAASGAHCVLVSGGFDFFTRRVAIQAGFHEDRANRFVVADGHLTGAVEDPILGREAKLAALVSEAGRLGLDLSQAAAIGDGANDLAMIGAAGLGLAYRAKPVVAAEADAQIDHADLTAALYFMGFTEAEFVRD
ncbi:MAG: phosphoserine phosphatase SerB [Phenylobacterium sp.]